MQVNRSHVIRFLNLTIEWGVRLLSKSWFSPVWLWTPGRRDWLYFHSESCLTSHILELCCQNFKIVCLREDWSVKVYLHKLVNLSIPSRIWNVNILFYLDFFCCLLIVLDVLGSFALMSSFTLSISHSSLLTCLCRKILMWYLFRPFPFAFPYWVLWWILKNLVLTIMKNFSLR